ncbi:MULTISPECIES: hypothetical protein [Paenibacillus]|uniref:hypothetical protein n=1 Tax=Paenibacillus TaxID=44249 RepID=UPI0022B8D4E7|nr:hypothetical protein [Paenibacillus caseinilyticus]MCZ8523808.1 hypothetical protein [Paenibacillus caseinilyticus]
MKSPQCWKLASALLLAASLAVPVPASAAQPKSVQAILAPFPIQVNGTQIDILRSKYPPLLYKNITYFPLTWEMAQALNWQVNWNAVEGLKVAPGSVYYIGEYQAVKLPLQQDLSASNRAGTAYRAQLPGFPVQIGEEVVNNAKETYPLLTFRDITYFPLTWHFANELLHLNLQWSAQEGLSIRSPQDKILNWFVTDDVDHLYFNTSVTRTNGRSVLQIRKDLTGKPVWMTREEAKRAVPSIDKYPSPTIGTDVSSSLRIEGDKLYYKDLLLPVEPNSGAQEAVQPQQQREAWWIPLQGDEGLLSLKSQDLPIPITARTPPYRAELFHVKNGTAVKLQGFRDLPEGVISNPDGSHWIYVHIDRRAPFRDIFTRSAQLALLDKAGTFHLINDLVPAKYVNVLRAEYPDASRPASAEGTLLIDTAEENPNMDSLLKPGGTIYSIDTKLRMQKVYTFDSGYPFADRQQNLYLLHAELRNAWQTPVNQITAISAKKTKFWWDYELLGP